MWFSVRNGTEAPDLSMVGNLWAQYQNALVNGGVKLQSSSPPHSDQPLNSPNVENPDESSSSGQKEDDDASEDDSDDRLDQNTHDPERLKAFNVSFVYIHFYVYFQFKILMSELKYFHRCLFVYLSMRIWIV